MYPEAGSFDRVRPDRLRGLFRSFVAEGLNPGVGSGGELRVIFVAPRGFFLLQKSKKASTAKLSLCAFDQEGVPAARADHSVYFFDEVLRQDEVFSL